MSEEELAAKFGEVLDKIFRMAKDDELIDVSGHMITIAEARELISRYVKKGTLEKFLVAYRITKKA